MKILFLVHVEEMFRQFFPPMYVPRICKAMNQYDDIYVFCSHIDDDHPIQEIYRFQNYEQIEWAWGYEPTQFPEEEQSWVIPSNGHEWTWVPEELRETNYWNRHEIHLGGGSSSECLEDMREVLANQKIKYKEIRGLVY